MTRYLLPGLLFLLLPLTSMAQSPPEELSNEEAVAIISTFEQLGKERFKVLHIFAGTLKEKDGFTHYNAMKVSFIGPNQNGRGSCLRHYTMRYSATYGWFLQRSGSDARGFFLEISSQKKGRVFTR
ncbi:MAG: hypothetical protein ACPG32_15160 [Akkermansiaceae bacterium]